MTRPKLLACNGSIGSQFGLGDLSKNANVIALRWKLPIDAVDGGMPDVIANVLATALTDLGEVVFPSWDLCRHANERWEACGGDLACALPLAANRGILGSARGDRRTILIATRGVETALRLFDDSGFSWAMGAQCALVARSGTEPPSVRLLAVEALMGSDWVAYAQSLFTKGYIGALRAGVDGDIAGFSSVDRSVADHFTRSLEQSAKKTDVELSLIDADRFQTA